MVRTVSATLGILEIEIPVSLVTVHAEHVQVQMQVNVLHAEISHINYNLDIVVEILLAYPGFILTLKLKFVKDVMISANNVKICKNAKHVPLVLNCKQLNLEVFQLSSVNPFVEMEKEMSAKIVMMGIWLMEMVVPIFVRNKVVGHVQEEHLSR